MDSKISPEGSSAPSVTSQNGSSTVCGTEIAAKLCTFAGKGDLKQVKRLVKKYWLPGTQLPCTHDKRYVHCYFSRCNHFIPLSIGHSLTFSLYLYFTKHPHTVELRYMLQLQKVISKSANI